MEMSTIVRCRRASLAHRRQDSDWCRHHASATTAIIGDSAAIAVGTSTSLTVNVSGKRFPYCLPADFFPAAFFAAHRFFNAATIAALPAALSFRFAFLGAACAPAF